MSRIRTLSRQTLSVLSVLAARPTDWLYGLEIAQLTELKSGSLYPILIRLSDRAFLESKWLDPSQPGRPARHAYRITAAGLAAFAAANASRAATVREANL